MNEALGPTEAGGWKSGKLSGAPRKAGHDNKQRFRSHQEGGASPMFHGQIHFAEKVTNS